MMMLVVVGCWWIVDVVMAAWERSNDDTNYKYLCVFRNSNN